MISLQYFRFSLFVEVIVKIHPTIVSMGVYGPSTTSSSSITEGLRRLLSDPSSKSTLKKKIGCFDYKVLDDRSFGSHVTVLLKFLKEPDVKTIEEYCYNEQLAKILEQYCMSMGLHMELGYSYRFTKREFRFKVTFAGKYFIQKTTGEQDSLR